MKVCVIGTGYWGRNHVRVWRELLTEKKIDGLMLCDINEEAVKELASGLPYTTDYKSLLKSDIEIVDIVTPSSTHCQIATDFLRAGKDIFVEKPMALNSKDAKKMVEVAKKTNRILMVGHIFRYHPAVQELKKRIERGDMGTIYYIFGQRLAFAQPRKDMGVLFALGIHEADLFCYLLNEERPRKVQAYTGHFLQPGIEEFAVLMMSFKTAKCIAIESWLSPGVKKDRNLLVVGNHQSAKVDFLKHGELQIFDATLLPAPNLKLEDEGSFTVHVSAKEPLKLELEHFLECVKNRTQPLSDMYVGLRAVEIIEEAIRNALS